MCGLIRNYEEVKSTLHKYLLSDLQSQNAEIDSFVHSDKHIEILNLRGKIIKADIPRIANIPVSTLRFHECYYKLVLPYMKKHKIEYDFFLCIRPDQIYFKNCLKKNISEWSKDKINIRMRLYPTQLNLIYHTGFLTKGIESVDDQFFIISKNIADLAFSIKFGNHPILCKTSCCPEGQLTKLWNSNNLKFELLPVNVMIHNWRFDKHKMVYTKRKEIEKYGEISGYWSL